MYTCNIVSILSLGFQFKKRSRGFENITRMQLLSDMIHQCYNNFCQENEKRAQIFLDQLRNDCFELYSEKIKKIFADEESAFKESDLLAIHNTAVDESLKRVCTVFTQKKFLFNTTTNINILYFFLFFQFSEKAGDLERSSQEKEVLSEMISSEYLNNICKSNDERISDFFIQLRADCFKSYSDKMQTTFNGKKSHFEATNLQKLHEQTKKKCYAQVCMISVHFLIQ